MAISAPGSHPWLAFMKEDIQYCLNMEDATWNVLYTMMD